MPGYYEREWFDYCKDLRGELDTQAEEYPTEMIRKRSDYLWLAFIIAWLAAVAALWVACIGNILLNELFS